MIDYLNVKTIVIFSSLVIFVWIIFFVQSEYLDLKKREGWLYGAISFLCGFVPAIALNGGVINGLIMGSIFSFLILFKGANERRHKLETEKMTKELLSQYENEELPPLFSKILKKLLDIPLVKKIFNKYK